MSLIDVTYFFGEFNIGQKSHQEVKDNIQRYIDTYEAEYLEKALGEDFAALYNGSTDPRFDDLTDMLKKKPSPIAGYVFFNYQNDMFIQAGGMGDVRTDSENSERSPETYRMTKAWNIMVKYTKRIQRYLRENKSLFPEFSIYKTDCYLVQQVNSFGL